jgi:calcineurin-like phosphoesterase family protein
MNKEYITLKELEQLLNSIPMVKIETKNDSWGVTTPNYINMVTPDSIMYYVKDFIKSNKCKRKRKLEELNEQS